MRQRLVWLVLLIALPGTLMLGICLGSVRLPLGDTLRILLAGPDRNDGFRRVSGGHCAIRASAAGAMRGADRRVPVPMRCSHAGASAQPSGGRLHPWRILRASLGAILAILLGISFPGLPFAGTMVMAMLFAFGSLMLVLALAYVFDKSLSTGTIILVGVIFSMFVSSLMSLLITFAGEKLKTITFWTLGSLSGSTYWNALTLLIALLLCGGLLMRLRPRS